MTLGVEQLRRLELAPEFTESQMNEFLQSVHAMGISDVCIQSNDFIFGHDQGMWVRLNSRRLESAEVERCVTFVYEGGATGLAGMMDQIPLDFSARLWESAGSENMIRFRGNATAGYINGAADGISVTMRRIPGLPPTFESLYLPTELHENFLVSQGLVAVVGTTGSGKTTLLAAANRARLEGSRPVRILIYEDVQEYVYDGLAGGRMPEPAQIIIGQHLKSYHVAGPNAMRRKGDVIIVGETRDRESMEACFEMATSGHGTYHTLHCENPDNYFTRAVNFFTDDVQPARAAQLLDAVRLVAAQKLYRGRDGRKHSIQSWVVKDRDCYVRLEKVRYQDRAAVVREVVEARGASFAQQALPALRDGLMTFEAFRAITSMTPIEGVEFLKHHGLNAADIPANEYQLETAA
jgi:defect-in-organelle-trafficking protein DotB